MANDVQGIPDVKGLAEFIAPDQEQSSTPPAQENKEVKQEVKQEPASQTPPEEFDLAQFKTPKDLLKGYKEVQGAFTRTTQENKELKGQLEQMKAAVQEQLELMRLSHRPPPPPPPQKDFDQMFIENPEKAVEMKAAIQAQQMVAQSRIQDVLEEENLKAPQEFNERYRYAQMIAAQMPNLVTSQAGVRKLFQLGDKLRTEQQKAQASRFVQQVFGDDVDFEKFKQLLKRDQSGQTQTTNAYMPDSSSSRNKAEQAPTDVGMEINEGVKKGDPDAVLKALFRQKGL